MPESRKHPLLVSSACSSENRRPPVQVRNRRRKSRGPSTASTPSISAPLADSRPPLRRGFRGSRCVCRSRLRLRLSIGRLRLKRSIGVAVDHASLPAACIRRSRLRLRPEFFDLTSACGLQSSISPPPGGLRCRRSQHILLPWPALRQSDFSLSALRCSPPQSVNSQSQSGIRVLFNVNGIVR